MDQNKSIEKQTITSCELKITNQSIIQNLTFYVDDGHMKILIPLSDNDMLKRCRQLNAEYINLISPDMVELSIIETIINTPKNIKFSEVIEILWLIYR
jgi:sialic acid synthase SpsE